jgi:hypothetical protein
MQPSSSGFLSLAPGDQDTYRDFDLLVEKTLKLLPSDTEPDPVRRAVTSLELFDSPKLGDRRRAYSHVHCLWNRLVCPCCGSWVYCPKVWPCNLRTACYRCWWRSACRGRDALAGKLSGALLAGVRFEEIWLLEVRHPEAHLPSIVTRVSKMLYQTDVDYSLQVFRPEQSLVRVALFEPCSEGRRPVAVREPSERQRVAYPSDKDRGNKAYSTQVLGHLPGGETNLALAWLTGTSTSFTWWLADCGVPTSQDLGAADRAARSALSVGEALRLADLWYNVPRHSKTGPWPEPSEVKLLGPPRPEEEDEDPERCKCGGRRVLTAHL